MDPHHNGHVWTRWLIGGCFGILGTVIIILWNQLSELRDRVEVNGAYNQATRALLDERSATFIPIINESRGSIAKLQQDLGDVRSDVRNNNRRIEALEKSRP